MNGKSGPVKFGERYAVYEEKKEVFKTDDATVEVVIKLKKKNRDRPRSKKSQGNQVYNVAETIAHRAGSWGDLLLRKKTLAEYEASVSNAGDPGQGQGVPVKSNEMHKRDQFKENDRHRVPPSEENNGDVIRAQVGGFRGEDSDIEPKTIYHRKKSKYTKLPQTHRYPPNDSENRHRPVAPNTSCNHHEKHNGVNGRKDLGKIQLQVSQPQSLPASNPNKNVESRCCDACTCCFKPNDQIVVVKNTKNQESQTSVLVHKATATATPSAVSVATTTQTSMTRSPPTKEIEVRLPPKRYSRQQQPSQRQSDHNMNNHSTGQVKPRLSNSSPNKHSFQRVSATRRSETAITTNTSHITTRRKEDSQVQVQVTDREGRYEVRRSNSVAGKPPPPVNTLTLASANRAGDQDQVDHEGILQNLKKLSELEMENLKLKKDTATLLQQVDKAKNERQEYITTIKELYELAEVLRHENVILIGTHEEHRSLQDKLLEAVGENQVLKQHLQQLTSQLPPPTTAPAVNTEQAKDNHNQSHIKDFWRVRDILKEVKTVIADEIHGLQNISLRKTPPKIDDSDILELFEKMGPQSRLNLNDTNGQCDDEVQHILNVSKEAADRSDVRSSTQYMDVGGSGQQTSGRHFVPSPCSDLSSL